MTCLQGGAEPHAVLVAADPLTARWKSRDLDVARVLPAPLDVLELADTLRALAEEPEPEAEPPPLRSPEAPAPRVASTIPPVAVPFPPSAPADAWSVLGVAAGAAPAEIERATRALVARWEAIAHGERTLDRRAHAATMVARIRAARRQALGQGSAG